MLLTLDSSLIVAALRNQEADHETCLALLAEVADGRHQAVQPLTVLVEVVAAIRRRTGSTALADRIQSDLLAFPNIEYVELDRQRAEAAAHVARGTGVRGMDAIVVATAMEFGSALVTLDSDIRQRASGHVTALPARDILQGPGSGGP